MFKNIINTISEVLEPFKKLLFIIGLFLLIYLVAGKILPAIQKRKTAQSPVVSIEASNDITYKQGTKIKPSDFKVNAKHKNGKTTRLKPEDFIIDKQKPDIIGKYTRINLAYNKDKKIKCTVKVKNQRDAVVRFNVGTPNLKDVKATLYDNGELCFEGNGDVLQFQEYPWMEYDEDSNCPVKSVSFEKNVKPISMDNWFYGLTTLIYVDTLPDSVESLSETFAETSLKKGVDWSKCTKLRNLYGTYRDCIELQSVPSIPSTVRLSSNMCEGCVKLSNGADCTKAEGLEDASEMYLGCSNLISVSIPPKVIDLSAFCKSCINLKECQVIPNTVENMESTFSGDVSLTTVSNIPSNVIELSNCFNGCKNLEGTLIIDANPENYNGWLNDAVVASNLNLTGKSKLLNELGLESANSHITVNKKAPVAQQNIF